VKLYGIRSCDNCRAARTWLDEHGIDHDYVDIRADGLEDADLRRWEKAAGWEELLNRRSITWRKIPAVDREDLDARAARRLILAYPTVLKRPVLDLGDDVLLGFDEDAYRDVLLREDAGQ
jgi:arsenate reductase